MRELVLKESFSKRTDLINILSGIPKQIGLVFFTDVSLVEYVPKENLNKIGLMQETKEEESTQKKEKKKKNQRRNGQS